MISLIFILFYFGILAFTSGAAYGKFSAHNENFREQLKKEHEKMFPK